MAVGERIFSSSGPEQTRRLGQDLVAGCGGDAERARVFLLRGEMGSGKTVLVQGMASALGIEAESVQSPTYQLIHEHQGAERLIHVDLYRLDPGEVESLGLDELLAEPGLVAIEWAERLPFEIPGAIEVTVARGKTDRREFLIRGMVEDR